MNRYESYDFVSPFFTGNIYLFPIKMTFSQLPGVMFYVSVLTNKQSHAPGNFNWRALTVTTISLEDIWINNWYFVKL